MSSVVRRERRVSETGEGVDDGFDAAAEEWVGGTNDGVDAIRVVELERDELNRARRELLLLLLELPLFARGGLAF